MSDLRVALVAEGPTDGIVIEAALRAILGQRNFVFNQLQPESSLAFGPRGGGWRGVYHWCKQAAARGGGKLSNDDLLFQAYDLLLIHVDVDVAASSYQSANIVPSTTDGALPCDHFCPPAAAASDQLRAVVLSWCGEATTPTSLVLCVPSRCTEAWVIGALFPQAQFTNGLECLAAPETWMSQLPVGDRIQKKQKTYRERADEICTAWASVVASLPEASRFQREFEAAS